MGNNPDEEVQTAKKAATATNLVSAHEPTGSIVVPVHVIREMTIYPIPEHELEMLKSWGSDKTLMSSLGSGILALLAGCIWDWSQLPEGTTATPTSKLIFWVLVAVCASCYARAGWRAWKVNKALKKIETRTEV